MSLERPRARALLALLPLLVLTVPIAHAAKAPARSARSATTTGPLVEASRSLPCGELVVTAASRASLQDPARADAAIAAALDSAARLAPELTADAGGELARLNASATAERFACSANLYAAVEVALTVAAETDGAYDPTAGPLRRLWEQPRAGAEPDPIELADVRQLVGWRLLMVEPGTRAVRIRRPGVSLVLDGVAGSCVMQRAAAVLRERGIARARLELAGEVLTFTNHDSWSVAVPRPGAGGATAMQLRVSNAAVATAGGADPLDPRTGRPPSGEGSVTVVVAPPRAARALAEALRVLGRAGAADYAARHGDVGVLWLEPMSDGVRAWAWNLGAITTEPGLRVEWKDAP